MNAINPGIRDMVDWLQSQGLTTIDSGDGQTRDYECDREHPYHPAGVVIRSLKRKFRRQMLADLERRGYSYEAALKVFNPQGTRR